MTIQIDKTKHDEFYKLLYTNDYELSNEDISNSQNIENIFNNKCLISNEKLNVNNITLQCGHKFNYIELYNEVIYQKSNKQYDNVRLKINQIKCPYCRQVSNFILPYYKYYNISKTIGVNWPQKYSTDYDTVYNKKTICEHVNCDKPGCISLLTGKCFCNNHLLYTNIEEELLLTNENKLLYNKLSKLTVNKLKFILQDNNLKLSGLKNQIINRIILNIKDIDKYLLN
tara:strand:+ start:1258 stop:1941 length:684 start_codon:yes stop_codon:yes gene_type:complete